MAQAMDGHIQATAEALGSPEMAANYQQLAGVDAANRIQGARYRKLQKDRVLQEKDFMASLDILEGDIKRIGMPQTQEARVAFEAKMAEYDTILQGGVAAGHVSPKQVQVAKQKLEEAVQENMLLEHVLRSENPVTMAIRMVQGDTGLPNIDNAPPEQRLRALSAAVQLNSIQMNQEASFNAKVKADTQTRFNEAYIDAAETMDRGQPLSRDQEKYLLELASTPEQANQVRRLASPPAGEERKSDPVFFDNLRGDLDRGVVLPADIQDAVAQGHITPKDGRALIDRYRKFPKDIMNSVQFDAFKNNLNLLLPDPPKPSSDLLFTPPDPEAAARQLRKKQILAKVTDTISRGTAVFAGVQDGKEVKQEIAITPDNVQELVFDTEINELRKTLEGQTGSAPRPNNEPSSVVSYDAQKPALVLRYTNNLPTLFEDIGSGKVSLKPEELNDLTGSLGYSHEDLQKAAAEHARKGVNNAR
jgi:hypothetical protein